MTAASAPGLRSASRQALEQHVEPFPEVAGPKSARPVLSVASAISASPLGITPVARAIGPSVIGGRTRSG